MTDMMINSARTSGPAPSVATPSAAQVPPAQVPASPVPVTTGADARPEVGSSWGLMLVPILICVVLTLYVSLI